MRASTEQLARGGQRQLVRGASRRVNRAYGRRATGCTSGLVGLAAAGVVLVDYDDMALVDAPPASFEAFDAAVRAALPAEYLDEHGSFIERMPALKAALRAMPWAAPDAMAAASPRCRATGACDESVPPHCRVPNGLPLNAAEAELCVS